MASDSQQIPSLSGGQHLCGTLMRWGGGACRLRMPQGAAPNARNVQGTRLGVCGLGPLSGPCPCPEAFPCLCCCQPHENHPKPSPVQTHSLGLHACPRGCMSPLGPAVGPWSKPSFCPGSLQPCQICAEPPGSYLPACCCLLCHFLLYFLEADRSCGTSALILPAAWHRLV